MSIRVIRGFRRFIGEHGRFQEKDRERLDVSGRLAHWHEQIQPHLPHIKTIYAFFNNDFSGHSPATCNRFKALFNQPIHTPKRLTQGRLF